MLTQPTQSFTKGMIIPMEGGGQPIMFQWNPKVITRDKGVKWAQLKPIGREQPILQYAIGDAQAFSLEMDVSEAGGTGMSAAAYLDQFFELTKPTAGGAIKRPPKLRLVFGNALSVTCILTGISDRYGPLFHPSTLGPQQGTVRLTFLEFK